WHFLALDLCDRQNRRSFRVIVSCRVRPKIHVFGFDNLVVIYCWFGLGLLLFLASSCSPNYRCLGIFERPTFAAGLRDNHPGLWVTNRVRKPLELLNDRSPVRCWV